MKIFVLPDVQCKPGHDFTFLRNIGRFIVDKKPDHIVCIGDFADMPSLSSYDVGKKSFEGRRYRDDIQATLVAMETLFEPIEAHNKKAKQGHRERYNPEKDLFLGNHEARIEKAVENDAKLDGVLSIKDLQYESFGWKVHPFLKVKVIENIAFSHYFVTGVAGRPASTAAAQLSKMHMSCIAGHQQGLQIATGYRADGKRLTSVIAGSCYEHDEDYMGPQGNSRHWRGGLMLHDVHDGEFNLVPVPLDYINKKYG